MARVIVSAGHTNKSPGTTTSGVREVDLTRAIAKHLTRELRKNNIITLAIPPDLELSRRLEWINQTGYSEATNDIAIEIHINEGGKSGIEGWYQANKDNSKKLTETILEEAANEASWTNQGAKNEYEHELGSLAFLHNTSPVATLIECGYMDNPEDLKFLQDESKLKKLAVGIAKGIAKYLGVAHHGQSDQDGKVKSDTDEGQKEEENAEETRDDLPTTAVTTPAPAAITKPINPPPPASAPAAPPPSPIPPSSPSSFGGNTSGSFGSGFSSPGGNFGGGGFGSGAGFGSGGSNFGGGFGGGAPGTGTMSRDDRREMIKKTYVKILGREPNQSDLNYFLNIGITEDQLIKKMVDSQEHADLVKSRQEVITTKQKFVGQQNELLQLRAKVADQKGIINSLNGLLIQKNRSLVELQRRLQFFHQRPQANKGQAKPIQKKSFTDRFLDYWSDKLG